MIGLVNAVGVTQALRHGPTSKNTSTPSFGEPPMWISPPEVASSDTATNRAVKPVEFQGAHGERHLPDGDESQEHGRAEVAERLTGELGSLLDVTG